MTQILEKIFRSSLNKYKNIWWFIKLQVHPLSYTKSPADFLVMDGKRRVLVECKECDCRKRKGTFEFARLSQKADMLKFDAIHSANRAYVLISFRDRFIKNSDFYMIPICGYCVFEQSIPKKSANRKDFSEHLDIYRMKLDNKLLGLDNIFHYIY